jgi:adenylyl-sulfate kinase
VAHLAKLFWDANVITLVSFISPFRHERDTARDLIGADFVEIFVDTPIAVCEGRDPKGLYRRARKGEIAEFTGISSPYEPPEHPELVLHTDRETVEESVNRILAYLHGKKFI